MQKQYRYKTEFGFHTPEKTKKIATTIEEKTSFKVQDVSWHNDLTDSLMFEGYTMCLYIPNSEIEDHENEQYNHFSIKFVEDACNSAYMNFNTLYEVIAYLIESGEQWSDKNKESNILEYNF